MRELIPVRSLVIESSKRMKLDLARVATVAKAWNNIGTQNLANHKGPLMTSRTKHISIKYHWFRSRTKLDEININIISTDHQRADIFTKGLIRFLFEKKKRLVMGW